MLPSFPTVKARFSQWMMTRMHDGVRFHTGVFGDCPKRVVREGSSTVYQQHHKEGVRDVEVEFKAISVESQWKPDPENPHLTIKTAISNLDEMAKKLAHAQQKIFFEELNKNLSEDQTIDATNREIDGEIFFEMVQKLQIEFNSDGSPIMPTLVAPPDFLNRLLDKSAKLEEDPIAKKRMDELIEKKRQDFHARKACRRLVS